MAAELNLSESQLVFGCELISVAEAELGLAACNRDRSQAICPEPAGSRAALSRSKPLRRDARARRRAHRPWATFGLHARKRQASFAFAGPSAQRLPDPQTSASHTRKRHALGGG